MVATTAVSTREAEVLHLVGQHLSNAEIGARLYISVRTVESHVSSLLRKFGVADRRTLARTAVELSRADPSRADPSRAERWLPRPLTSLVGRVRERSELGDLLRAGRHVTAVGPGGIGKTRLALAVAAEGAAGYPDGVWFVDLVPTTDPEMVATAVAEAIGLGEQPGRSIVDSLVSSLAEHHALLVLDNCERVRDAVALLLERLLPGCPRVSVLATSRARLMVPYERVYQVPPLSTAGDGGTDALALFLDRAAVVGSAPDPAEHDEISVLCERLDGMALAIELAAARWPALGLRGLTTALSDPLRMLTGGSRTDHRHHSVRAALDWSHALLAPDQQVLLRQVSVFAARFTVEDSADVTGLGAAQVADGLARLAEQSLLEVDGPGERTSYRALETIRQYGAERLAEAGESVRCRTRHLRWCLDRAAGLIGPRERWRARFDEVADDLRAALGWAGRRPELRREAGLLAGRLAELTFACTLVGESQRRYEQAAELAVDPAERSSLLRRAAAVAGCRMRGDDMYRLRRAAAAGARESGDTSAAVVDLATAATTAYRFSTTFDRVPGQQEVLTLLTEARAVRDDDPAARAAVALAEAAVLTDAFGAVQGPLGNATAQTLARAELAVELADHGTDPLARSAALDALIGAQGWAGRTFAAAATARRRIELLPTAVDGPARTHELIDALGEAVEAELGAGDLRQARRWARQLADHPLLAEVGHRASSWLLLVDAVAGEVEQVLQTSVRFLEAWQREGRPARSVLGPAVAGVAMVHGLRDDEKARREWDAVLRQLHPSPGSELGYGAVFDAVRLLHHGRPAEAWARTSREPSTVWRWVTWIWHHWYLALRAEAAVLAGRPDAADRVTQARPVVTGNPVAEAMVQRADALLRGEHERLPDIATSLETAGAGYQAARTLVHAGGDHAVRGQALLAGLGCAPMVPPGHT